MSAETAKALQAGEPVPAWFEPAEVWQALDVQVVTACIPAIPTVTADGKWSVQSFCFPAYELTEGE